MLKKSKIDSFFCCENDMRSLVAYFFIMALPVLLILYSPILAFFVLIIGSTLVSFSNFEQTFMAPIFYILGGLLSLSIALIASSQPVFLFLEQDFTTYYNNYYDFYSNGFSTQFFPFGKGVEVGLPLVNYLLTKIIDGPYPNLVKFYHAFFQSILLLVLVIKIRRFEKFNFHSAVFLLALSFLFFKFPSTLNHLRQGYSSVLMLIAIFSVGRVSTFFWLILAASFHLSSLALYPLIRFVLTKQKARNLKIPLYVFAFISVAVYMMLDTIVIFLSATDVDLLGKLVYGFDKSLDVEYIMENIKIILTAVMYLVPIFLYGIWNRYKKKCYPELFWNVVFLMSVVVFFIYLPAIPIRSFSSVFYFGIGYIYFVTMINNGRNQINLLIISSVALFIVTRWIGSPWMSFNYPLFGTTPLYFSESLFFESDYVGRSSLPLFDNINLDIEKEAMK
ncbi:EpsG family protein [Vibrio cyclitrophicus]